MNANSPTLTEILQTCYYRFTHAHFSGA